MNTLSKLKVSDIPPTTLRLPPDVRVQLLREAEIARRSLSQECTERLVRSLERAPAPAPSTPYVMDASKGSGAFLAAAERQLSQALTDNERLMLSLFNSLSPEKQLSLLTLLKR